MHIEILISKGHKTEFCYEQYAAEQGLKKKKPCVRSELNRSCA